MSFKNLFFCGRGCMDVLCQASNVDSSEDQM
jgi:hypothetical protein